jgi:hypothetical protein
VQKVFIDGDVYFDREQDMSGRNPRETRRKVLLEQQRKEESEARRRPQ